MQEEWLQIHILSCLVSAVLMLHCEVFSPHSVYNRCNHEDDALSEVNQDVLNKRLSREKKYSLSSLGQQVGW